MMPDERRTTTRPSERPEGPSRPFRTLLAEHQGREYGELDDGRGKVRLWHFGHRIAVLESSGSISEPHADFVVAFGKKHIEAFPRPWVVFGNWMTLLAYTPEVRPNLTEWQRVTRYDESYVAHNSRLLAMSVSLANGVLDNSIKVLNDEEALDDVLISVRRRMGV